MEHSDVAQVAALLGGLGAAGSAIGIALGAALLYAGFVAPATLPRQAGRATVPPTTT